MLLIQRKKKQSFYSQFLLYLSLLTPSISQQLLLLPWLLRVTLILTLIPMGILGLVSDQFYLKALKENDLFRLEVAKEIFPFERDILIGPAQFYFRNQIVDNKTLDHMRQALYYDPYSVQFLGAYIQLEYLNHNKNEALIAKRRLEKIAPNSNVLKKINDLTKGLK